MKKSELEEAYRELQYRYNKLHSDSRNEIKKLEFFLKQERKNAITDLEDKKYTINLLHAKFNNEFYMLYGKEISYFTLFRIFDSTYFSDDVIDCLNNVGDIKAIDFTEAQDAIEIWIQDEDGPTCLYLFPYDMGLVEVGE